MKLALHYSIILSVLLNICPMPLHAYEAELPKLKTVTAIPTETVILSSRDANKAIFVSGGTANILSQQNKWGYFALLAEAAEYKRFTDGWHDQFKSVPAFTRENWRLHFADVSEQYEQSVEALKGNRSASGTQYLSEGLNVAGAAASSVATLMKLKGSGAAGSAAGLTGAGAVLGLSAVGLTARLSHLNLFDYWLKS